MTSTTDNILAYYNNIETALRGVETALEKIKDDLEKDSLNSPLLFNVYSRIMKENEFSKSLAAAPTQSKEIETKRSRYQQLFLEGIAFHAIIAITALALALLFPSTARGAYPIAAVFGGSAALALPVYLYYLFTDLKLPE